MDLSCGVFLDSEHFSWLRWQPVAVITPACCAKFREADFLIFPGLRKPGRSCGLSGLLSCARATVLGLSNWLADQRYLHCDKDVAETALIGDCGISMHMEVGQIEPG